MDRRGLIMGSSWIINHRIGPHAWIDVDWIGLDWTDWFINHQTTDPSDPLDRTNEWVVIMGLTHQSDLPMRPTDRPTGLLRPSSSRRIHDRIACMACASSSQYDCVLACMMAYSHDRIYPGTYVWSLLILTHDDER